MKKLLFMLALLLGTTFVFNACKKDDDNNKEEAVMTSEDLATAEDFSEQLDVDADEAIENATAGGGGGGCPTVTFAQPQGTWPNTMTIDFGAACPRPDGRILKGKIIVNQTGEIRTSGTVRTISHDGFYVDTVKVEGTRTWTNNGLDANGHWSYTKTATNMKLTYPDGSFSTWSKTRTSALIQGGGTPFILDDVWSSTGSASGVNRNGNSYTATVTDPLIKKIACRYISEGAIEFTRNGNVATLDFGDGTCDRFGQLTVNGQTYTIRLRR